MRWEDFRESVRRRKRERWARILESEGPGRLPGRRPRDPEKEALLTELDRLRIAKSTLLSTARRVPPPDPEPGA